jgi:hypothetical protein
MNRRIVLEDSQIHFFEKLADLSFTEQKDSGLWVPPEGLASGAIAPRETTRQQQLDNVDLAMTLEIWRTAVPPPLRPEFRYSFNLRSGFSWQAMPNGAILLADGKRLDGFHIFADIK